MAGLHLLPVAVVLLLLAAAVAEGDIKISVRFPSAEDSEWLDRWAAKYSDSGSEHGGFEVTPATDEESAYLNRMVANAKTGYDGHMEFDDNDRPRLVVDALHHSTTAGSSEVDDDDDLWSQAKKAHVEDL
ncbi:hypothetical protein EJB05_03138 [Eragrostis curvula]|uniref:Cathepsin propeptide inhibitor domain-containing protein n=1 Tax=Eragrostis curvula TaxID=38414 RepID=A0A5J9WUX3_9POAL|nr:hypothetical protein EJB05_03138 [Eragrostis curvula]